MELNPLSPGSRRARLLALRDELLEARLSGVREVQDQNGERIRYGTDAEMAAAIRAIDVELAPSRSTTIRFATSKGL